ncbi:acyl-CoA dehydrogenase family protein [Ferrovibrio sp.]|uniref:acyl-CoA dehydrogenase family protein n=1 Tax=Ferrovibrio sp. TaxID=1917215 RepID=UPI000CBFA94C|nr:acyl-CoA dehydrogenase family protein [Ferrovibrio sp.]PJI39483.1 MAG: acyl-CoA dehydrogenase [Ferrovibrio sp.]
MTVQSQIKKPATENLAARIAPLGEAFAASAVLNDASDRFAADNFALIKQAGILPALIPAELGGLGAGYRDVADMLRSFAGGCSGTALALSMHMHPVALLVRRWRGDPAAVEAVLKRIATENLMLLSTGGNDWLAGSGSAVKVEGGYRFSGRKRFVSGCEAGNLLMTMAVCDGEVLHAAVPMKAEGVSIEQTWRTLGMRASGSHDVVLKDVFVADAAISARRPAGVWHPFFHLVTLVAFPLIYSVYRGVAEKLRDETVRLASKRREDTEAQILIGAMDTALATATATHERMLQFGDAGAPGEQTTATMMTLKRAMTESLLQVGALALDAAGGSAFYRDNGIERLYRDLQAARYHPFTMLPQQKLAGRIAMGLNADGKAA